MIPFKEAQTILKLAIFLVSVSKAVSQENISVQPVSVEEWTSDFIDSLNVSCTPRDECKSHRNEEFDHLVGNNCECGEQCIDHDTCCIDSPHLGRMKRNRYDKMCTKVVHSDLDVFMMTSCETEWNGDPLSRSLCESDSDTLKDPSGFLPVTSSITKVSYKNYFCAVCNNDNEEVDFWQISFAFNDSKYFSFLEKYNNKWSIEDLVYGGETNSWGIIVQDEYTEDKEFRPVLIKIIIPEKLTTVVKFCYPDMVSSCDPTWRDVTSIERCEEYMDAFSTYPDINYFETKVYRNVHCAVCNYVNDFDSYHCAMELEDGDELEDGKLYTTEYSSEDIGILSFGRAFYNLLNVKRGDKNKNGRFQSTPEPKPECRNDEVYDVYFDKCRRLHVPGLDLS